MTITGLGLQIPSFTYPGVPDSELFEKVASIATTAEASGFDAVWVMDHLYQIQGIGPSTDPMLEAYSILSGIAARTGRVNLGALVTGVTYRNPAFLAKTVTTLDIVSSGRAVLGIGAAWNEEEHRAFGYHFPPVAERMERLEDTLRICRAMFREQTPSITGKHHAVEAIHNVPRPVRPGGPPILVGGMGERKTLRLVAQYGDACNLFGDPGVVRHKLDVLERHCADVGRDPTTIEKTRLGTLLLGETDEDAEQRLRHLAAAGADEAQIRGRALVVGVERLHQVVADFVGAGLDGLIFNLPDVANLDAVAFAGQVLSDAMGKSR